MQSTNRGHSSATVEKETDHNTTAQSKKSKSIKLEEETFKMEQQFSNVYWTNPL